jgi:ferredoxin-NADP reductase
MTIKMEAQIKEVIQRTENVKSIRVAIEDDPSFKSGQFLNACFIGEKQCCRYLSISSSPTEKGYIEFTKKITESDFSKMAKDVRAGDMIKLEYPFGKFTLDDPKAKIAFLSGGIGITPIRSICKYVVDSNLGTDMILVYANRSINDIVFKDDFGRMQEKYLKLKVAHVLYEPAPGFKCTVGLINAQVIKNQVSDYVERKFYICGPPQMVISMKKILSQDLGLPEEKIITENFQGY